MWSTFTDEKYIYFIYQLESLPQKKECSGSGQYQSLSGEYLYYCLYIYFWYSYAFWFLEHWFHGNQLVHLISCMYKFSDMMELKRVCGCIAWSIVDQDGVTNVHIQIGQSLANSTCQLRGKNQKKEGKGREKKMFIGIIRWLTIVGSTCKHVLKKGKNLASSLTFETLFKDGMLKCRKIFWSKLYFSFFFLLIYSINKKK